MLWPPACLPGTAAATRWPTCLRQGVYRGLADTRPPFAATLACNGLNVLLGWALIFGLRLGVTGAASATVAAQVRQAGGASGAAAPDATTSCAVTTRSGRGSEYTQHTAMVLI